jgi:hypothetical protein
MVRMLWPPAAATSRRRHETEFLHVGHLFSLDRNTALVTALKIIGAIDTAYSRK